VRPVYLGLIGFGTVGSGVARLLLEHPARFRQRLGAPLVLKKIADIDLVRPRPVVVPPELLTSSAQEIVDDPEIDIVIELMGGTTQAYELVKAAIARGKHVVTANKALLALHGNELFRAAAAAGVSSAIAFTLSRCAPGSGGTAHEPSSTPSRGQHPRG